MVLLSFSANKKMWGELAVEGPQQGAARQVQDPHLGHAAGEGPSVGYWAR